MYFSGHYHFQSLSKIFFRVAYPVEPLRFSLILNDPLSPLFDSICDGSGEEPDLFKQLDEYQTDEFQFFHSHDFGVNFPQGARDGKKDGLALILVFADLSLWSKPVVGCCVSVPRGNTDRHPRIGNCQV